MDIKDKVAELPTDSGVYIMKNADGEIIYVGKAKNLKNRVSQYFQSKKHLPKVAAMVSNVADFEYIVTNTEYEALGLENNLIKRYQPFYNILLKDGKSYPYIRIDTRKPFPNLEVVRKIRRDGARYFGPYIAGLRPRDLIQIVHAAYPLRACKGPVMRKNTRPCLNYDLGICSGPCAGKIQAEEYHELVNKAIRFLNGRYEEVAEILENKMQIAADNEQYERALMLRDSLKMVKKLGERTTTFLPTPEDLDVFAWATNGANASIAVLVVRGGRSIGCDYYHLVDANLSLQEALTQFIMQYYTSVALPPDHILLPFEIEINSLLEQWIQERREKSAKVGHAKHITLSFPQRGIKRKLMQIAERNAEMSLEKFVEKEKRDRDFTVGAVTQLGKILGMSKRPSRMEAYDISNIGGVLSVASMVVFVEGVAKRNHYRKFKIKTVEGANDFASMQEVISRRLNESKNTDHYDPSFNSLPDLIVIDGGKGQLSNAQAAMKRCGFNISMIGLAKREEEIFLPHDPTPILLPKSHNALRLLQRIRDEAHRYAITYHRSLRNKLTSILDEIPGIGEVKRKALVKHFKSIDKIKEASIAELQKADGITLANAKSIYEYFNKE